MNRSSVALGFLLGCALASPVSALPAAEDPRDDGFALAEPGLPPAERAGAEIWYKATAGSARFTT
jgi:hypothetical protein